MNSLSGLCKPVFFPIDQVLFVVHDCELSLVALQSDLTRIEYLRSFHIETGIEWQGGGF